MELQKVERGQNLECIDGAGDDANGGSLCMSTTAAKVGSLLSVH